MILHRFSLLQKCRRSGRSVLCRLAMLMFFCFVSMAASAQQKSFDGIQLTPIFGYTIGGDVDIADATNIERGIGLKESISYGFALNGPSKAPTEWELYFNHQETQFKDNGPDVSLDTLQLGGTYLGSGKTAIPYIVATLGGMRVAPKDADNDYLWSFTIGGGYKFFPSKRIGLRLEGRVLSTLVSSDSAWFCGSNNGSGSCVVRTSGNLLLQFQANAGIIFRF